METSNPKAKVKKAIKTTCPYCGVGCGIKAEVINANTVIITGDETHRANFGRLCSKGTALASTLTQSGRLLEPKIRKNGVLQNTSWDEALTSIAQKFNAIIQQHGPDSVAFYVSGQLLTEDYYVVNKLAKGYIGTANIDTNSRLCMSSAVAAHKLAFGEDLVPAQYEDVELADLVIFSGHNAAWTHPVLYRRLEANTTQKRICIDPRRTDTAKSCDLHLMIRPQSDVRLWNGLCAYLITHDALDDDFIINHTQDVSKLYQSLAEDDQSLGAIARDCDISEIDLKHFYDAFMVTPKTVSLFSQGSNQSSQGVNKALALINAHLLSGKIGKIGAAAFSITGQPNAMGGREVGGLANSLAAHMDFDETSKDLVKRFWQSPKIAQRPGLKAVDMFEAIGQGKIKAVWIMATNPLVSMPDTNAVRKALEACELVIVSDIVEHNDTLDLAHIQLPACGWGEKDGTVTNSERVISRQRAFLAPAGQARPDWAIIADVARRMNKSWETAFDWKTSGDVFDEHARLTAFENNGQRVLNLSGLTGLNRAQFDDLPPTLWPIETNDTTRRLFDDGIFATPSLRARFNAVKPKAQAQALSAQFPLSLNSARVRDHWHTLTRTGLAPELNRHVTEPLVDIHPELAQNLGIKDGQLAQITTAYGEAIIRARHTLDVRKNDLSLPIHWTNILAPYGRSNPLISPNVDPLSGQPEFKHTPARIAAYNEIWHGFIMLNRADQDKQPSSTEQITGNREIIWRLNHHKYADIYEIAGKSPLDLALWFQNLSAISLDDVKVGIGRRILIKDDQLKALGFIAPIDKPLPSRDWLLERFGDLNLSPKDRASLLIGGGLGLKDRGPLICACHGVGLNKIEHAVEHGANSVEAIGVATQAGTNCGSCKGELAQCLKRHQAPKLIAAIA